MREIESTTLYEKVGRRYKPVMEGWDWGMTFPAGTHLLLVEPGRRACWTRVTPDYKGLLAAAKSLEHELAQVVLSASQMQPRSRTLSPREQRAYEAFKREMGGEYPLSLMRPSAMEIAERVLKLIETKAQEMQP